MITYKESELPNGLKIITKNTPGVDAVAISVWFRAGSRYENKDELGYAHLFEHFLFSGNNKYPTSRDIAEAVEIRGGSIGGWTSKNAVYFGAGTVVEYTEEVFDILSHLILQPLLREEDLEKDKKIIIREMHRRRDDPAGWAAMLANTKTFGNHSLAHNPLGSEESILGADIIRLKDYYEKFFVPQKAVIITAGGLDHNRVRKLAEEYFGGWQVKDEFIESTDSRPPERLSNYFFEKREIQETYLHFNYLTPGIDLIDDSAALDVISDYLGRGMSSILSQELREKRRLTYNVSSYASAYSDAGIFNINTSTKEPEKAVDIVLDLIKSLKDRFTDDEVEKMKTKTVNYYKLADTNPLHLRGLGDNFMVWDRLFTTEEYVDLLKKVTKEKLVEAAEKYLTPRDLFLVVLGPKDMGFPMQI